MVNTYLHNMIDCYDADTLLQVVLEPLKVVDANTMAVMLLMLQEMVMMVLLLLMVMENALLPMTMTLGMQLQQQQLLQSMNNLWIR